MGGAQLKPEEGGLVAVFLPTPHGRQRKPVVGGLAEAAGMGVAMANPEDRGGTRRSRRGLPAYAAWPST